MNSLRAPLLVLAFSILAGACDGERRPDPAAPAEALARAIRFDPEAAPSVSAHRGGPEPGYPENCLETFAHSIEAYGPDFLECDVRRTADGALVLLHDEDLDRTTTGRGPVASATLESLRELRLVDPEGAATPYRIPTLEEALEWSRDRTVLFLDVKQGVGPEELVAAIRRTRAEDRVVVIVYTLGDLRRFHSAGPGLVYSVPARTARDVRALIATGIDPSHMIGFIGVGRFDRRVPVLLHEHGIRAILGTFGDLDQRARCEGPEVYLPLFEQGIDVLATDAVPEAARAVEAAAREPAGAGR